MREHDRIERAPKGEVCPDGASAQSGLRSVPHAGAGFKPAPTLGERRASGGLRPSGGLFRLHRRKVGVALDRRLAEMLPAAEQNYAQRNDEQRSQDGSKGSVWAAVVSHGNLRYCGTWT